MEFGYDSVIFLFVEKYLEIGQIFLIVTEIYLFTICKVSDDTICGFLLKMIDEMRL